MKYSEFNNHEESVGLLFWQVSTQWQRAIKEALREYDLTHTQYVILAVIQELNENFETVTQKNISDFSMIDPMTASSTLRLLEKKGLIQRLQAEKDSRANKIVNTEAGADILKKAIIAVEKIDKDFFFNTKEDLYTFKTLLTNLKK